MKVATTGKATGRRSRGPAKDRAGVGSVEVLPSGRFRVRVWVGGAKKGDTFATREEAERQRATLAVRHREVAEAMPPEPQVLTLAAWGKTWLERREELGQVRRPAEDVSRWSRYITGSRLDAMPLEEIRGKHVSEWVDAMVKRPRAKGPGRLSPQTIRHAFNLLRLALADAVRDEHIDANPCDGVKLPALGGRDAWAFLSPDEIAGVMRGADGVPAESVRAFIVATFTGMRQGELIALRWGDITLAGPKPEVHVQRSHDGPPKNGKSRRLPLFPQAVEALKGQLAHAEGEGDGVEADALVFPSTRGLQRQPGDDFGWSPRKRRGLPGPGYRVKLGIARRVRFHDLRSTTASHLAMGTWTGTPWPLQRVAEFLGHGSVAMTERYAHASPGLLHDLVRPAREAVPAPSKKRGTEARCGTEAVVPRFRENTVPPVGVEPTTFGLGSRRAIHWIAKKTSRS
jgi:integrase